MAIDLKQDVQSSYVAHPPILLIFGRNGLGKTTLGCSFPKPFLMNFEKSTPTGIDVPSTPTLRSYAEVKEWLNALLTQKHDYKTIVFDTLDIMEPMLEHFVCKTEGWDNLASPGAGFGRGPVVVAAEWAHFMRAVKALNERRGLCIVMLAHANVGRFDDPTSDSYSTYEVRLHKKSASVVGDLSDAVFFMNQSIMVKSEKNEMKAKRAVGNGNVWAYTRPSPAFNAKNPYGMPEKILIDPDKPYAALAPYLPGMDDASPVKKTRKVRAETKAETETETETEEETING